MTTQTPHSPQDMPRRQALVDQYGLVVGSAELMRLLGYRSKTTFFRHQAQGLLPVGVHKLPGRRGRFAATLAVADWMDSLRQSEVVSSAGLGSSEKPDVD